MGEVALSEFILHKLVGSRAVRHPQQRLGKHHQGQPFLRRERIFPQQILDTAKPRRLRADRVDQSGRPPIDARIRRDRQFRTLQQNPRKGRVIRCKGGPKGRKAAHVTLQIEKSSIHIITDFL